MSDIYVFNLDEEHQAVYAWTLVKHLHKIWIGIAASPMEFYLGPYFTYFTALLLSISKGDPMITAYFAAVTGSITSAVIFIVVWRLFSFTAGVISSILYATLPLFIFFDQKYWNPMFVPLIVVLLYLTLNLVKKSKWWWIVYAILLGIVLNTQLAPLPLFFIGLWLFVKGGYFKDLKLFFICLLTFMLFYWPLLVFDFNHNFSNMKALAPLFKKNTEIKTTFDPVTKFNSLFDSLGRFWYLKPGSPNADEINFGCTSLSHANDYEIIDKYTQRTRSPLWLSLISISLFVLFYRLVFKKRNSNLKLLAVFYLVFFSFFMIYPGGAFEYYYLGFLTLFTFVPGILVANSNRKLKPLLFVIISVIVLIGVNTTLRTSDEFSLRPKKLLIKQVMDIIGNEPFSIDGRGICHNYEGWRYLFKIYGRLPVQSYSDRIYGWIYTEEIKDEKPVYTVILSEDRIPLKENFTNLPSIKVGGYRAYVKKNIL
ncbi:MAG: glycosyltransferase family 39 protein [Actinobacteria bacterium]|nr:glycosyltransferase family 39 protein [Actinomycetota bacterium]